MIKDECCSASSVAVMVIIFLLLICLVLAIFPDAREYLVSAESKIFDLAVSTAVGLVSGIYTGIIVSRINRFSTLRSEVLNRLNDLEYMGGVYKDEKWCKAVIKNIRNVASEFYRFKHKQAGNIAMEIAYDIERKVQQNQKIIYSAENDISGYREKIREVKFSKYVYSPCGDV